MPRLENRKSKKDKKIEKLLQLISGRKGLLNPSCPDFGICGGCSFLNIHYEDELELKKKMVAQLLEPFFNDIKTGIQAVAGSHRLDIIPSPNVKGYRNKMELSFGDYSSEGGLALGIRKKGRYYEVAVPTHCVLIPTDFKAIIKFTLDYFQQTDETFYHRKRHTGSLRYLVLRIGEFTGEILVNLVTTTELAATHPGRWTEGLLALKLQGKIVGILHTTSNVLSDAVVPEEVHILWGKELFHEKICGLTFGISPFSFFQTNSAGAALLYHTVAEFAGQQEKANLIYDLYCGTGTIAQVLSPKAKEVIRYRVSSGSSGSRNRKREIKWHK